MDQKRSKEIPSVNSDLPGKCFPHSRAPRIRQRLQEESILWTNQEFHTSRRRRDVLFREHSGCGLEASTSRHVVSIRARHRWTLSLLGCSYTPSSSISIRYSTAAVCLFGEVHVGRTACSSFNVSSSNWFVDQFVQAR